MGCGYVLAADRFEFVLSNAVCALASHGIPYPARYLDLFSRYRLPFLGNTHVLRAALLALAVERAGLVP